MRELPHAPLTKPDLRNYRIRLFNNFLQVSLQSKVSLVLLVDYLLMQQRLCKYETTNDVIWYALGRGWDGWFIIGLLKTVRVNLETLEIYILN